VEPPEPKAESKSGAVNSAPHEKSILRWILLAVGAFLLLAGTAFGIYWMRHRRHPAQAGASAASAKSSAETAKNSTPLTVINLPLEPFVVNLADAGGHSYARIGITLHLVTPASAGKSASAGSDATASDLRDMVRDQIIDVLNRQESADLLAPDGKEHLKQAIAAAILAKNPQFKVIDIYFTQFLVQS